MGNGIGEFAIGNHKYKYEELAPIDALRFGTQCVKTLGPAASSLLALAGRIQGAAKASDVIESVAPALASIEEAKLEALLKVAYGHTYTPQNESLGNEAVFNGWFREHPHELFQVGLTALYMLAKDFFPKPPVTVKTGFRR